LSNGRLDNGFEDDLPVFMDLVSHDILNINQTVLSAIELMIASSRADEKSKMHARRVESQIRISTQIFESMKMLCVLRKSEGVPTEPVDLNESAKKAITDVLVIFGDKRVGIELDECAERTAVRGGAIVKDVLVNAMMGLVQLDKSDHPMIRVSVSRDDADTGRDWVVSFRDENVVTPPSLGFDAVGALPTDKRTKMVKLAGLILARMLTEKLGGSFESGPSGKGSEIRIKFSGAE
jgi:two-component sensor histidine kinase